MLAINNLLIEWHADIKRCYRTVRALLHDRSPYRSYLQHETPNVGGAVAGWAYRALTAEEKLLKTQSYLVQLRSSPPLWLTSTRHWSEDRLRAALFNTFDDALAAANEYDVIIHGERADLSSTVKPA